MESKIIYILLMELLLGSILVTSGLDKKSSEMDQPPKVEDMLESTNLTFKVTLEDIIIKSLKQSANNFTNSEKVQVKGNEYKTNSNLTYHEENNKNTKILNDFDSDLVNNLSKVNKLDYKINKLKLEEKHLINDKHLREERSDFSYDYDQDKVNNKRSDGNSDNKNTISEYKSDKSELLIRHENGENGEERARTFNIHKNGLKIMSHLHINDSNSGAKNKLGIENFVMTRNNETMKSLGSIDLIVPSLEGMRLPPGRFGDHNFSRIDGFKSSSRTNRTNFHALGRTDAPMLNYIFDTYSTLNKHHHRNDRFGGPKIETPGSTVKVDTEQDAILECKVTSLQDKLVSWLRRRPDHETPEILTIGQQAYTADTRISVDFMVPNTWRLILRTAVPSDSGIYECQLSTHPPIISRHELIVHAPVIEIVEADGDKYYERNSTLELGCRIRHISTTAITWFHQSRNLNDDTIRGGINVKTEAVASGADSLLQVARLTANDGGKYTCSIRDGLQASINVYVLNAVLRPVLDKGLPLKLPMLPILCRPYPSASSNLPYSLPKSYVRIIAFFRRPPL